MTPEGYIQIFAPIAVAVSKEFGGSASAVLGQFCLEPGFGLGSGHELLYEANNFLGMKYDLLNSTWTSNYWHGDYVEKETPEYYGGKLYHPKAKFRKYNSLEDCARDYMQFLRDAKTGGKYKYRDVLDISDPRAFITQVSKRGYATDPAYIESVMRIVNQYQLTQYDVGVKTMVTIGSARIDENGNVAGGTAGDNNGREISTQPYYNHSKGWYVFRAKSVFVRELLAEAMEAACANDNIGYDQGSNQSLYSAASKVGFDLSKVTTPCETDCARLVRCCIKYAGIDIADFYTGNQPSVLSESGYFDKLEIKDQEVLARGDILVTKTKGHTAIVLVSGSKFQLTTREAQKCLRELGWYTDSVDGDYGTNTQSAVRRYQYGWRGALVVDGEFGPKTSLKLTSDYAFFMKGKRTVKITFTKEEFCKMMQFVADDCYELDPEGKKGLNLYGDNDVFPIGRTFKWSCDRLIADALYRLGITDQPAILGSTHGLTVKDLWPFLEKFGAVKITKMTDLRRGDIVIIGDPSDPTFHAFAMASDYGPTISKWDFGRDARIEHRQPVRATVVEKAWSDVGRYFNYGIRLPFVENEFVPKTLKQALVYKGQTASIKFTGHEIQKDGVRGFETNSQLVRCLQHAANLDWNSGLEEDGDLGPLTQAAFKGHYICHGETQWVVTAVEIIAYCKGLDPAGVEYPGHFGDGLATALGDKWLSDVEIFKLIK